MVAYTPDKIRAVVETSNLVYQTSVLASGGKFHPLLLFMVLPGTTVLSPAFVIFYDGPEAEAREFAKPLYDLGPTVNVGEMMPYTQATTGSGDRLATHHRVTCSAAKMTMPLDVDIVETLFNDFVVFMAKYGVEVAGPSNAVIELGSQAVMSKVPVSAMEYAARQDSTNVVVAAKFEGSQFDGTMREEMMGMTRKLRRSLAEKVSASKPEEPVNANYAGGTEKVNNIFGENLPHLREMKMRYDPDMVFNKWYHIQP